MVTSYTPTFVLVHGAWSGAHGFRRVRQLLQSAGLPVFTPSLTGIGERVHLTGPQVNLSTHIGDVVNHILYEDHHDIVLLGFSYGGMVVTGALDHIADRVRHLVYLDAFVPDDGQCLMDLIHAPTDRPMAIGDPWSVPPTERQFDDPVEAEFMGPRRTAHPIACFTEAVHLGTALEDHPFQRTYIRATADRADAPGTAAFDAAADRARRSAAWHAHEIATNHMVASNRPAELAALLLAMV